MSDSVIVRCSASGYANLIQLVVDSGSYCGTASELYTCSESSADLWVQLTWDDTSDLDLHVWEPDSTHVYWSSKTGVSGELDVDDTNGYGPENYTSATAATGTYTIWVKCYSGCSSTGYTLHITKGNQSPLINTGTFTSSNTDTSSCGSACDAYSATIY